MSSFIHKILSILRPSPSLKNLSSFQIDVIMKSIIYITFTYFYTCNIIRCKLLLFLDSTNFRIFFLYIGAKIWLSMLDLKCSLNLSRGLEGRGGGMNSSFFLVYYMHLMVITFSTYINSKISNTDVSRKQEIATMAPFQIHEFLSGVV